MFFEIRCFLLLLVLSSSHQTSNSQTPATSGNSFKFDKISIACEAPEKPPESETSKSWYEKGLDVVLGDKRCDCYCPPQTTSVAIREITDEAIEATCKTCYKMIMGPRTCFLVSNCVCWFTSWPFLNSIARLIFGCMGDAVAYCSSSWYYSGGKS